MKLTGKTRYRTSFFGKMILQVEYRLSDKTTIWKDATQETYKELRKLTLRRFISNAIEIRKARKAKSKPQEASESADDK